MSILSTLVGALKVYAVPLIAIAGVGMAAATVIKTARPKEVPPLVVEPAKTPFASAVAGSGVIETNTQNILVGTTIAGVIKEVLVKPGDMVKVGDPLFAIDAREVQALLAQRESMVAVKAALVEVASRKLDLLKAYPRPETVPPAAAKVDEITSQLADAMDQLKKYEAITDKRAVSDDMVNQKRFSVATWQTRLAAAQADLALIKAGTFAPEVAATEAQVTSAKADLAAARADADAVRVELDRRIVRSSIDGRILQVNAKPGEYASAGAMTTPLIVMGGVDPLHVRVDVDENEAWRVKDGSHAVAFLRGNTRFKANLTFVRFEPLVVPKKSLTGESSERVDTRVLQLLFALAKPEFPVYVGQQVDVYIEAPSRESAAAPTPTPTPTPESKP